MADDQNESPSPPIVRRDYRDIKSAHKTITFIKAQSSSSLLPASGGITSSLGDSYLSIVLPSSTTSTKLPSERANVEGESGVAQCEICHLPLSLSSSPATNAIARHESSLAHQVCLEHTHPPSALDRSRKGLAYLQWYGWDPDGRRGLGSIDNEGILYPITSKEKKSKAGIGAAAVPVKEKKDRIQKMNVKEARTMAKKERRKNERLQRMFYSSGELEKYLGTDTL